MLEYEGLTSSGVAQIRCHRTCLRQLLIFMFRT
jgi:hypothetical protein